MTYQEQFKLLFTKQYFNDSKNSVYNCRIELVTEQSIVLRELLATVQLMELIIVLQNITRIKEGILSDDFAAFDGMEEALHLDQGIARLGEVEFSLLEFESLLHEWVAFCKN